MSDCYNNNCPCGLHSQSHKHLCLAQTTDICLHRIAPHKDSWDADLPVIDGGKWHKIDVDRHGIYYCKTHKCRKWQTIKGHVDYVCTIYKSPEGKLTGYSHLEDSTGAYTLQMATTPYAVLLKDTDAV